MKKILMLVAFIAVVLGVNAQKGFQKGSNFATGSFMFQDNGALNGSSSLDVSVSGNTFVSNSVAVGVTLGINSNKFKATDYLVGAQVRKYVSPANQFSVFYGAGATVAIPGTKSGVTTTTIAANGGASYFVSNHFALETSIAVLQYQFNNSSQDGFKAGLNLQNIQFGVVYKF